MKRVVGLTGGIATGKSTVSVMFRDKGAFVVDADAIARRLLAPGSPMVAVLRERFGPAVFQGDGQVNRRWLRDRIAASAEDRQWLNAVMHPEIIRREEAAVATAPAGLVIVDAALMFETGSHKRFDTVIVVYAPRQVQLARLMARDGMERSAAEAFLDTQMDVEKKKEMADHVIDNSGSLEETRRQVETVYGILMA